MTLPSPQDMGNHLQQATDDRLPCHWPNKFGLPQLCQEKNAREPRGLVGVVAGLQKAAKVDIDVLASRYNYVQYVKRHNANNPDPALEITKNCLEQYGSTIWSNDISNRQHTTLNTGYPRQLDFSDATDRSMCVTCVFIIAVLLMICLASSIMFPVG
jgi:hypothetical protein